MAANKYIVIGIAVEFGDGTRFIVYHGQRDVISIRYHRHNKSDSTAIRQQITSGNRSGMEWNMDKLQWTDTFEIGNVFGSDNVVRPAPGMAKPAVNVGALLVDRDEPSAIMLGPERGLQFAPIVKHKFVAKINGVQRRNIIIVRDVRRDRIGQRALLVPVDGDGGDSPELSEPLLRPQFLLRRHVNGQTHHIAHVPFTNLDIDQLLRSQVAVGTMSRILQCQMVLQ